MYVKKIEEEIRCPLEFGLEKPDTFFAQCQKCDYEKHV